VAAESPIVCARQSDREALDCARQRTLAGGFRDQMQMIRLHGQVHHAQPLVTQHRSERVVHGYVPAMASQPTQAWAEAQCHMQGVAWLKVGAVGV
jgi:hypothetical protein